MGADRSAAAPCGVAVAAGGVTDRGVGVGDRDRAVGVAVGAGAGGWVDEGGHRLAVGVAGAVGVRDDSDVFAWSSNTTIPAQRNTIAFPSTNPVTITYGYTSKTNKINSITPSGGTGYNSVSYSYTDSSGNEHDKVQSSTTNSVKTTYSYDTSDRLTSASPASGTSYTYTYDVDGNVKTSRAGSASTIYYGYNEDDELCWSGTTTGTQLALHCPSTPTGDTAYSSDKNGNNLGTTAGPIVYNFNNQATNLTAPDGTGGTNAQTYTDLGNDLRTKAGSDTLTTGQLGVTARTTSSGTEYYTRDPQGNVIGQHGNAGTNYFYTDRLNSTLAVIGGTSGNATATFTYSPYGATTLASGTTNEPWRYTGQYFDTEGDNYYHEGARYNDTTGHFTQPDSVVGTVSKPSTLNPYTYASGDPVNNIDPAGRCTWAPWDASPTNPSCIGQGISDLFSSDGASQCADWGGAAVGATLTYGWYSGPVDWAAAGINGAWMCAAGAAGAYV